VLVSFAGHVTWQHEFYAEPFHVMFMLMNVAVPIPVAARFLVLFESRRGDGYEYLWE
jgi:hypothetical protein